MPDHTIEREIVIDAPAEVVWRTITEPDQITQWFADRVQLDLRPGGTGSFGFGPAGAESATVELVVEVVDEPHRFAFRWGRPGVGSPRSGDSIHVEFTLAAEGDERTRLRVVETGLGEVGWPDEEKAAYVDDHRKGWALYLDRLAGRFATAA